MIGYLIPSILFGLKLEDLGNKNYYFFISKRPTVLVFKSKRKKFNEFKIRKAAFLFDFTSYF